MGMDLLCGFKRESVSSFERCIDKHGQKASQYGEGYREDASARSVQAHQATSRVRSEVSSVAWTVGAIRSSEAEERRWLRAWRPETLYQRASQR